MKFKVIKLYFRTPVHIGEVGIGLEETSEILHSDTIFSAMVNALSYLGEDVSSFIEKVREGGIKISSAYPFFEEYYFPKPLIPPSFIPPDLRREYGKKIKELKFIPKDFFEKWVSQIEVDENELKELDRAEKKLSNIKKYDLPKVSLDRRTKDSSIYYIGLLKFKEGGLYFLLDSSDNDYSKFIEPALNILREEGFGGKRTWGLGQFEFDVDTISLDVPKANSYVTLSLVYPENVNSLSYWQFIKRGGWVYSKHSKVQMRKPKVLLISEASAFREYEAGILLDLDEFGGFSAKIGHKVYLNGKSFLIPAVIT